MAKWSLHGSPSGHEVVGDDGKGGTSNEEVTHTIAVLTQPPVICFILCAHTKTNAHKTYLFLTIVVLT